MLEQLILSSANMQAHGPASALFLRLIRGEFIELEKYIAKYEYAAAVE